MKIEKVKYEPQLSFELLGISSHEEDYVLAWNLSNALRQKFYFLKDLIAEKKQLQGNTLFGFEQNTPNNYNIYGNAEGDSRNADIWLVANKQDNFFLIEELRNFDYLLIKRNSTSLSVEKLLNKVREIACVVGAYEIEVINIKSKEQIYILWDSLQNKQ